MLPTLNSEEATNAREAEEVVSLLRHLWLDSHVAPTVGVVTFNQPQRELIEDAIAAECLKDRVFRDRWTEESQRRAENQDVGFFVKNLENVQGDERDVVIFSTTFGRDDSGAFYRRFGPVGAARGHRRLNVAITRARQQVIVVTSLPIDEISDALRQGRVRVPSDYLQLYMAYCRAVSSSDQTNANSILSMLGRPEGHEPGVPKAEGGHCESQFESDVYEALCKMGYEVHRQVGESGFRIDLAVVHPRGEHLGYVLGIECDGATYHSDRSARIRDIWREDILRGRGWQIYRVWSTRWWNRRAEELERLRRAVENEICRLAGDAYRK